MGREKENLTLFLLPLFFFVGLLSGRDVASGEKVGNTGQIAERKHGLRREGKLDKQKKGGFFLGREFCREMCTIVFLRHTCAMEVS